MRRETGLACATIILASLSGTNLLPDAGPFDGRSFKGRIAYSADGNYNDEDDWAASAVALAIFAEFGVQRKLVHFDYNSILNNTDARWEGIHETSVLGAAERFGYSKSVFHDCRKNLDGALDSIRDAINASSADDPLYFIVAGPMEVAYRGIQRSDPAKRPFVYVISHSRWNDGYATEDRFNHTKRSVIPQGIHWIQIADQNRFFSTSPYGRAATEEEWRPWHWMRDSDDAGVRFLWERMRVTTRADCSDAGMAWFLMTGNEEPGISDLKRLLDDNIAPAPVDPRKYVRIEAENFVHLENCEVEFRNDRGASHRINVKLANPGKGRIRTQFRQPYTATVGRYDVEVRYFDEKGGRSRYALYVNGAGQGESWLASADDQSWRSHTIPMVRIGSGDEIRVDVEGLSGESGRLDYVQLNYKDASTAEAGAR